MENKNSTPILILGILGVIVLIGALAGAFILLNNQDPTTETNDTTATQDSDSTNTNSNTDTSTESSFEDPGTFTDYDESLLSGDKVNILFFSADWCPTCQSFKRNINASLDQIPTDVQILEIPYDTVSGATQEHLNLRDKYEIDYQHNYVMVDENLNMIKKWYGSATLSDLLEEADL